MDSGQDTGNGGNSQGIFSGVPTQQLVIMNNVNDGALPAPVQQPVVTSGTGDVMLPVIAKKKRKWPIVVALVAVVAMVGVGILIWRMQSGLVSSANVRKAFNEYANYLLFGEKTDKDIDVSYDSSGSYTVRYSFDQDNSEAYFADLSKLLDTYMSKYNGLNIDDVASLGANNGIASAAVFVVPYGLIGVLDSQDLLELVVENEDIDGVLRYIKDYYSIYVQDDDPSSQTFYDLIVSANSGEAEVISAYRDAGCIIDDEINADASCEIDMDSEIITKYKRDKYYAMAYIKNSINNIIYYTFKANDALKEWSVS